MSAIETQYKLHIDGSRSKRATWEPDWLAECPQLEISPAVTADSSATALLDAPNAEPIRDAPDDQAAHFPTDFEFVAYSEFCWSQVWPHDYRYVTAPRITPSPCAWCGGRLVHSELCNELRRSWEPVMPFGKFKGRRLSQVPPDYLEWLVAANGIDAELREAVQVHLQTPTEHR